MVHKPGFAECGTLFFVVARRRDQAQRAQQLQRRLVIRENVFVQIHWECLSKAKPRPAMGTRLNRLLVSVLFHFVGFEDVAQLDVAEALQRDAAVVAVLHFLHVVLETL